MVLPPMLTFPSCSSRAADIILSRKMLKRVGERRHPCLIPTVVLNRSPVLPFIWTALIALSHRCSMARARFALILYFRMVAHKAACHTLSNVFYAPAYSKNSGRALSVIPVRPVRPSVRLSVRTSHFRVRAITPKPYGIYSWNFTGAYITIRRCVMNKEDNSCIFGFWIISPWLNSI